MEVPFFDLSRQYEAIREEVEAAMGEVMATQRFIGGPVVERFEAEMAAYHGVSQAIGVSSGTDALLVSLMALGIGKGDEVITTPFTFVSPAEAILRLGARPVFVDVDATYNLDVSQVEAAMTERTRAILPVHLYGQACDMGPLMALAESKGVAVVEDMAQAIGARLGGQKVGTFGDVGCVSFFPTKNLGGAGDGGMVLCDDDELAEEIRLRCRHGARPKYHHVAVGGNFRLDALQAAVLTVKLAYLDGWSEDRRTHGAIYDEAFSDLEGLRTPVVGDDKYCVYHQYTVACEDREALVRGLNERGIGCNIYYPEPLHEQPAIRDRAILAGSLEQAERAARQVVSLPVFPELKPSERDRVISAVRDIVGG